MTDPLLELDEDVHCKTCGYNLRTALITGVCSECGCPVAESIEQWRVDRQGPDLSIIMRDGCLIVGFLFITLMILMFMFG